MYSAGKRTNTEGAARGKRKLQEQAEGEAEFSNKPKIDDS